LTAARVTFVEQPLKRDVPRSPRVMGSAVPSAGIAAR
jgi:hypothetical protein